MCTHWTTFVSLRSSQFGDLDKLEVVESQAVIGDWEEKGERD